VREGTLLARRFDAATAALSGDPIAVAQPVEYSLVPGFAQFTSSRNGVVAYQSHSDLSRVTWFDRSGRDVGTVRPTAEYLSVRLTPDGRQMLFERTAPGIGTNNLWQLDLERGVETPVTSDPGNELRAVPVPDRSVLVYAAGTAGAPQVVVRDLSTGVERLVDPDAGLQIPEDVSPDNGSILYRIRPMGAGAFHLRLVPLRGGTPTRVLDSRFNYSTARFSPAGGWLAYVSDESSQLEAYVTRWPVSGERVRLSTDGARHPRWSRDGRELFFLSKAGLVVVPMSPAGPGKAALVLDRSRVGQWSDYDVARDGRFLAIVAESVAAREPLTVLVNWLRH
jgi:Tol biopolymer transport system component